MSKQTQTTDTEIQKVVLVAVEKPNQKATFEYTIEEFKNLAIANNLEVTQVVTQKLDRPVSGTYFGSGKIEELKEVVQATESTLVISNDDLTATQIRNLEKLIGENILVVDRTALILDIFASRAKTKIAKLQVRLAQKQYQLPRLHTSLANELDQQGGAGGGSFTSRGAGETKLELSRRVIEEQISKMKIELKEILANSNTQRKQRDASGIPTVTLVGYTNAGKSTWMNRMIEKYTQSNSSEDKTVFEKDMLFATLDPTVRTLRLPNNRQILLSDTVGFVSNLPHDLIASFNSTLQEAVNADLLVQVVDISDPHYREMMETTEKTLIEIGADKVPMVTVFNKADRASIAFPSREGNTITASAFDSQSQEYFINLIIDKVFGQIEEITLLIPFSKGNIVNEINNSVKVLSQEFENEGTLLKTELTASEKEKYQEFIRLN
ncbi:MAG: GTPase HflX [Lactobacillaceae bacterium]|jgi:GTP-binding protein HflX|nr:GTPase HflX [Lactobacillaceae bacterium]